jgi:hypothetical protein
LCFENNSKLHFHMLFVLRKNVKLICFLCFENNSKLHFYMFFVLRKNVKLTYFFGVSKTTQNCTFLAIFSV